MNAHASPIRALRPLDDPSARIRAFLRRQGTALSMALGTVAGPQEARRAEALTERLRTAPAVTAADLGALARLHRLLSLDLEVEDPRWMHLQPDSDEVTDVCRMTDALAALLRQCEGRRRMAEAGSSSRRARAAGAA